MVGIVRQLVQISVVEAWRDRTFAGDDVFDSRMDSLQNLTKGERRHVLIFSIEEAEQDAGSPGESGFLGRDCRMTGFVQAGVATGEAIKAKSGSIIVPKFGETDGACEASLNLLDWQWRRALQDHENPWALLFRDLVAEIGEIKDVRATDTTTGGKHAARFTQFHMETIPDPQPGDALPDVIERGLVLLEEDGDDGYAKVAAMWRQALVFGGDWPEWRQLQSALFASRGKLAALGYGPLSIDEEVDFDGAQLDVSGVGPVVVTDDP